MFVLYEGDLGEGGVGGESGGADGEDGAAGGGGCTRRWRCRTHPWMKRKSDAVDEGALQSRSPMIRRGRAS